MKFLFLIWEKLKIKDLIYKMIINSGLTVKNEKNNLDGDIEIKIIGLRPGEKLYEELLIGDNPSKTSHEKIQKARDPFISFNELNLDLNILTKKLENNEVSEIKEILKKLVSTFKSETSIVDHLFIQQNHSKNININSETSNIKIITKKI